MLLKVKWKVYRCFSQSSGPTLGRAVNMSFQTGCCVRRAACGADGGGGTCGPIDVWRRGRGGESLGGSMGGRSLGESIAAADLVRAAGRALHRYNANVLDIFLMLNENRMVDGYI